MGMNPDTNKLEKLDEVMCDKLKKELEQMMGVHTGLVRPDGSPVPKTWSVFSMGEYVDIKGYTFKVAYIGETSILFEPVGPVLVGEKRTVGEPRPQKGPPPQRRQKHRS